LFAFRAILSKYLINNVSVVAFMFWFGIAELIFGLVIIFILRKNYKVKVLKGVKFAVLIGILAAIAYIVLFFALVTGQVSLVSILFQFSMLFTFIGAYAITKYHPKIIKEKISKEIIILKIVAIIIILSGGYLIVA
jgi:drug/metabolite transporter (DMT)-like permease